MADFEGNLGGQRWEPLRAGEQQIEGEGLEVT